MAFHLFAEAEVDVAVIETGLGGRLDATNAQTPLVAGVTGIALDHVEWLGTTREQIAPEKAGIYKPGVPGVVGERDLSIRTILAAEVARRGATPVRVVADEGPRREVRVSAAGTTFGGSRGREGPLGVPLEVTHGPWRGRHQASNAMVALTMLDAIPGPLRVRPDGRRSPALMNVPSRGGSPVAPRLDLRRRAQPRRGRA